MNLGTDLSADFACARGFGIRKIMAKQGWSVADRDATIAALQRPPVLTPSDFPTGFNREVGRYKFEGPDYSPSDPSVVTKAGGCRRIVSVDSVAWPGESQPRGIITSFGAFVPE